MTTPLLAPPEAQPSTTPGKPRIAIESLSRPFRLGLVGLGCATGLFVRLLAANGFGDLNGRPLMLGAALTSAVMGIGLLVMAAERDRFGAPLAWISLITALAWGALNWISPPFAPSVTVWSKPDQAVLAVLGIGNGLLLAGLVALAFVRRHPTMTVAATLLGAVLSLAANTIALRNEWPAIILLGVAFASILLAWDRSPRHELAFERPENPPRVSRAALSFISVALCGTAIQLWTSRTDIPRSIPAVIGCALLIIGAFASLVRVRREIEQRETTLSEWTSWAREIRTNDFRAEMQNFESNGSPSISFDDRPLAEAVGEAPRKLSFPDLSIPDSPQAADPGVASIGATPDRPPPTTALVADTAPGDAIEAAPKIVVPSAGQPATPTALPRIDPIADTRSSAPTEPAALVTPAQDTVPVATAGGAFSSMLGADDAAAADLGSQVADLDALADWLGSPAAGARVSPLLVAIEAMTLDEFDSLPPADAAMATQEIGSFLADIMPDADLVSWIDGPYFIVAHASMLGAELITLNKEVLSSLKATDGTLALLRPAPDAVIDDVVNECVMGLLQARRAKERTAGR